MGSTKARLATVLDAEGLPDLAARARAGEFDDFESQSATPIMDLVRALRTVDREDLAARAMQGEWDGTAEEGDAWAESEDGKATIERLQRGTSFEMEH